MKKLFLLFAMALIAHTSCLSQELVSIDDFVELHSLLQNCLSNKNAKSNYEKVRPRIVELAEKNGLSLYEYHHYNGMDMWSYNCFLYKNCQITKDRTGYPSFTPTKGGVSMVIDNGFDYIVYSKNSFAQIVDMVKKKCDGKLYTLMEDEEPTYFYTDGKLCYLVAN